MSRFRAFAQLDDPITQDGDFAWKGMDSRRHPTTLEPGLLALSQNMRLDKTVAKVRKGSEYLSDAISLAKTPITISFTFPTSFNIDSITSAGSVAKYTVGGGHGLLDGDTCEVTGASISGYNATGVVSLASVSVFGINIGTSLAGENPTNATGIQRLIIQEEYDDGIFSSGVFTDDSDGNEYIVLLSASKAFFVDPDDASNPIEVDYTGTESIASTDNVDLIQCLNKLVMLRGDSKQPLEFDGDLSSPSDFELVSSTAIGADGLNSITGTVSIASGAATVTGTDTYFKTDLAVNDRIKVNGEYNFVASIASDTTLTADNNWTSNSSGDTLYKGRDRLDLIPMPKANFGLYYQNRLILDYPDGSRNDIILSDILDVDTYDAAQNQFKLRDGSGDKVVGFSPYKEDDLVVFLRDSIHLIKNVSNNLDNVDVEELTREVGCIARDTIVTIGERIFFLSEQGVYSLQSGFEDRLKGYAEPLSKPIDDQINDLNFSAVEGSTAAYHNNRYYIAVPTGSSTTNNKVFVYNILNEAWESVDTYPTGLQINKFHIVDYGNDHRLFAVGASGILILLEEKENDETGSAQSTEINGKITTRRYTHGNQQIKKFSRLQADLDMPADSSLEITAITQNPDSETLLKTVSNSGTTIEDTFVRASIPKRGYGCSIQIETTKGRPEIRGVNTEAIDKFRGTRTFE